MRFGAIGAVALAGVMASAMPSMAATLDFLGLANTGETAVLSNPLSDATYVPIATYASGYNGTAGQLLSAMSQDYYAYLDGGDAGLGVCKKLDDDNECDPSNDDNVQANEVLALSWDTAVNIDSLSFMTENHPGGSFDVGSKFAYSLDSGLTWNELLLVKSTAVLIGGIVNAGEYLLLTTSVTNPDQFYLSSAEITAVPVPAGGLLLISGLAGLYAMRRRRNA